MLSADFSAENEPCPSPPDNRRGARQLALQALYWTTSLPGTSKEALSELARQHRLSSEVCNFAVRIVAGVESHTDELDALIEGTAANWSLVRIARLDNLILRMALIEMIYCDDVPTRVSIDEAVELAKLYSTERSFAFINGILDAVARQRQLPT